MSCRSGMSCRLGFALFLSLLLHTTNVVSALSDSNKKAPLATWSFSYPSSRMDWNELPRHVTLQSRAVKDNEDMLEGADVLVLAGDFSSNSTQNEGDSAWETSLLDFVSREDLGRAFILLKQEILESPPGTLSSRVMLRPTTSGRANEETVQAQYLCCLKIGKNLTTFGAVSPENDHNTSSPVEIRKQARALGVKLAEIAQKPPPSKTASDEEKSRKQKAKVPRKLIRILLPLIPSQEAWTELVISFWTTLYREKRYKGAAKDEKDDKEETPVDVELFIKGSFPFSIQDALERGASFSRGIYLAKDIVNAPHNSLNSLSLAETARRLAREHRSVLSCRILSAIECEQLGMGAYLGVARGSETEPQFIHLTYRPRNRWRKHILKRLGIVGKGLLFDTGGYNIKTGMMELMKFDCGGAASVLGAARAVAELQPENVEVHFCVAACENMISERAYVPSDILTASNGKTIEVMNTDAEGRLTMADALVYVDKELDCDEIVELSTLTGACIVSLGTSLSGLWTCSDSLAEELISISKSCGEEIWRMPLVEEYNEQLKSKIADIKNLGTRYGGAICAALFLQHFVEGGKPFAHIDMAGPVWDQKAGQASGWGVKLVAEWVEQKSSRALKDKR